MDAAQLEPVLAIELATYGHPWSSGNFADSLRSGYWCPTLEQSGKPIAYMVVMPGVQESHLLNITVSPKHRGQGLGLLLLQALTEYGQRRGDAFLWLEVRASNLRAQAIYAEYGFANVGHRPGYYPALDATTGAPTREDALVMTYRLHP
jgi:ribosomal-protein-alanine N-acetyltransferase